MQRMAKPVLDGLRVLLTRPECDGAGAWAAALTAAGASVIAYPTVGIVPPQSWAAVDEALARLPSYDWLVFTSQTSVDFVAARLPDARFPEPMRTQIAVIGPKTARTVAGHAGKVALAPSENTQEGLAQAMAHLPPGTRVLFPLAADGRTMLAESLRAQGCVVEVLTVYATAPIAELPALPAFDVATFASPSALRAFVRGLGASALGGKLVAVIGPTTAKQAAAYGMSAAVAKTPDADALIAAIARARIA